MSKEMLDLQEQDTQCKPARPDPKVGPAGSVGAPRSKQAVDPESGLCPNNW